MLRSAQRQEDLTYLREATNPLKIASLRKQGHTKDRADSITTSENPFDYLCAIQEQWVPNISRKSDEYGIWWNDYHHLHLFVTSVVYNKCKTRTDAYARIAEYAKLLEYTSSRLAQFLREVVAVTHPKEAECLLMMLGPSIS